MLSSSTKPPLVQPFPEARLFHHPDLPTTFDDNRAAYPRWFSCEAGVQALHEEARGIEASLVASELVLLGGRRNARRWNWLMNVSRQLVSSARSRAPRRKRLEWQRALQRTPRRRERARCTVA